MKKFTSLLLCAVLLLSLFCTPALAADGTATLLVNSETDREAGIITVTVRSAEKTTNGRFTLAYDSECLQFISADVSGTVSDVAAADSAVTVGYAAASKDAIEAGGVVAQLSFSILGTWTSSTIRVMVDELNSFEANGVPYDVITRLVYSGLFQEIPGTPDEPGEPDIPDEPDDPEEPGLTDEVYEEILSKYPDIKGHWAEEYIVKAIFAGISNGTSASTFSPEGVVTRGMFVTMLYRLHGQPEVSGDMPFEDVSEKEYYADAIMWAYNAKIVNGISEEFFAPNKEMTREQMVTMLYRYAQYTESDVSASAGLDIFDDAADVSSWAVAAVRWAVAEGIINGVDGSLKPADFTTRAQVATVLVRYAGL